MTFHDSRSPRTTKGLEDAGVAELVDATDSKSVSGNRVWVRFPPPAPTNFYFRLTPVIAASPNSRDSIPSSLSSATTAE